MNDGVVTAGAHTDPVCRAPPHIGIGVGGVVANRVVIAPARQINAMRAVVMCGIATDRGVGCAAKLDAMLGMTRHAAARVADDVVRDGDMV